MKITKKQLQEAVKQVIDEELMTEGPKMTRQHFQLIADALRSYGADRRLVEHFAAVLAQTNPGFKKETFIAAAGW